MHVGVILVHRAACVAGVDRRHLVTNFDVLPVVRGTYRAGNGTGALPPSDVRRWCSKYQKAFPWAGISCPAEALRTPAVATWVKKHGHSLDVYSTDELRLAVAAGIPPVRITMHDQGAAAGPIRCAVIVGVGRFVIGCNEQIAVLASCARQTQRVLVDVTAGGADDAVAEVLARKRLNLIGLHARLVSGPVDAARYALAVEEMVAKMAQIRRDHGVILTRVSLAGGRIASVGTGHGDELCACAAAIEDAFDDACSRFRFPRPALVLAPVA